MTYKVLNKKPTCRKWRRSRGIPNPLPWFTNGKDMLSWWSDGKRLLLQVTEHRERTVRDVPSQKTVRVKETHHHWYEVA